MHHILLERDAADEPWRQTSPVLKHPPARTLATRFLAHALVAITTGADGQLQCDYAVRRPDGTAAQARILLVGSCADGAC